MSVHGMSDRHRDSVRVLERRVHDLDALTRHLPDGLLRVDRSGRLRFVNEAAARLCGVPRAALLDRPVIEAGLPVKLLEPLDALFAGNPAGAASFSVAQPDGRRWYQARYVVEDEGEEQARSVLVIVQDVSERRRMLSSLAERERRMERALEEVDALYRNLSIGLCIIDRQHRVVRLNEEMARINGDPVAHLEGVSLERLHPVLSHLIGALVDRVLEGGESVQEHELDGAFGTNGERRHLVVDLVPLHDGDGESEGGARAVSCTVQDITPRKLTEQRLAARAAVAEVLAGVRDLEAGMPTVLGALSQVFDALISEYWTYDPEQGGLTCAVFRCSERFGDAEATRRYFDDRVFAPGKGLPGLVWVEGHARRLVDAGQDQRGARLVEACELGLRTGLGFPVVLDGRVSGVISLFLGSRLATDARLLEELEQIGRDIGECERRLRVERALEQARAAAEQANRSKSDFLANVSHELRSPLTAILGYADILDTRLSDPDDRHSVETVRKNGKHLLSLLNDVLDLAKIESGKFEASRDTVSLARIVSEVHGLMLVRAIERSLDFDIRFEGALPDRIVTDELRLRQILLNLVANAIKFTDTGSVTLVIGSRQGAVPRLVFDVIDTGIGMTAQQCDRLFEPFTQVDSSNTRRYGGTGLGLAISRRLARLLDGDIAVRSASGVGTTFTLSIPVNAAADAHLGQLDLDTSDARTRPSAAPSPNTPVLEGSVLVADDRPDIRVLVRRFLENAGAQVVAVADGEAAVEALRDGSAWPDAIIMDMQMPRLDGYEATRRLRASGFDRPVVALTAAAMKGERERCLDAGCNAYLSKPLDGRELVTTVATLIERYRQQAQDAASGTAESPARDSSADAALRILLVDDSHDAATATARLLTLAGHDVRTCGDGLSALRINGEWRPDVVLLDLGLPDIGGEEVARRIRATQEQAPVLVALSGQALERSNPVHALFDRHLLKPARLRVLSALLSTVNVRPRLTRQADPV